MSTRIQGRRSSCSGQSPSGTSSKSLVRRASLIDVASDGLASYEALSPKTKGSEGPKKFDFAQRSKQLAESDRSGEKIKLGPDDLVKRLKLLDIEQKDPLPLHIMWAWSQLKFDANGEVPLSDLIRLELRYSAEMSKIGDIVQMIKECDANNNKDLEVSEIAKLLVLAGGQDVTHVDAEVVRARLVAIATASVHGAYNPTMTTNPHLVSKAIFEWWWINRGNRHEL